MPDHAHLLFALGQNLGLSQVIAKWKQQTKSHLESHNLSWQSNFYDHRLRTNNILEGFARYIYLNPYRKNLVELNQSWPGWICYESYKPEFTLYLKKGIEPPVEWLQTSPLLEKIIQDDLSEQ